MRVYRCKAPFVTYVNGVPARVAAGALLSEDDPRRTGQPDQFEPVEDYMDRTQPAEKSRVEQATAAPGEKRDVDVEPAKRRGRPPGSKNKPKGEDTGDGGADPA